jgi:hypothetical protein
MYGPSFKLNISFLLLLNTHKRKKENLRPSFKLDPDYLGTNSEYFYEFSIFLFTKKKNCGCWFNFVIDHT